jgi:nucleoside-diphosphate-sugar epimerase
MSPGSIRVLVTGATGFLGSNVLTALTARPEVESVAACRSPERLPAHFLGEVRAGDLMDSRYREEVVKDVDVVCNAASAASMWGHTRLEREHFFEPARGLIEQAIRNGVRRFIQTSTVVIGQVVKDGCPHGDSSPTQYTRFWPHLDRLIDVDRYMHANSHRGTQMVTLRLAGC